MFCKNCGQQISEGTKFCPNCGSMNDSIVNTAPNPNHTEDYVTIHNFHERAKSIQTLGIVAAVLMFGIGIFFSIAIWVMAKNTTVPTITTTNPVERAEFEDAERKFKLGQSLAGLPLIAIGLCIAIGLFSFLFI